MLSLLGVLISKGRVGPSLSLVLFPEAASSAGGPLLHSELIWIDRNWRQNAACLKRFFFGRSMPYSFTWWAVSCRRCNVVVMCCLPDPILQPADCFLCSSGLPRRDPHCTGKETSTKSLPCLYEVFEMVMVMSSGEIGQNHLKIDSQFTILKWFWNLCFNLKWICFTTCFIEFQRQCRIVTWCICQFDRIAGITGPRS